jgi:DNA-directed RNA polymerase subunit RPC12/RpoP
MFPINILDIVRSPYGNFQVLEKENINNIIMCKGIFVDWKLPNGKNAKGTLNEKLLQKVIIKNVHCNDCGSKSLSLYHFYGIECKNCGSFNTQE